MITVIVPMRILDYLIKKDLEFNVSTQEIKDEYIKIEFKNCPMAVNKFAMAHYDAGCDFIKMLNHKTK